MKLLIGIPAYNESKMISHVIRNLPKKITGIKKMNILVIDDGSSDTTSNIARKSGAWVIKHLLNRGLGGALKTLLAFAKMKKYDILVTFDADGQHSPSDIEKMIVPIIKKQKDVVIGSRWSSLNSLPWSRFLVNQFANILTFILFGIWSSDTQSGLRAFNRRAIERINIVSDGMEVSSEFFKEIYRNKLNFTELPIQAVYTNYSRSKGQRLDNAPEVFFQLILRLLR